jgi:hypothetical protein
MKFVFVCPEKHQAFESDHFEVVENRGVTVDHDGNKTLDAMVELTTSCPFCGKKHRFYAGELACPFTPGS